MMRRICAILLALTMLAPSAQAIRKKTAPGMPSVPVDIEPDAPIHPIQPAQPMTHLTDLVITKRRVRQQHVTGKRGIDVSHYQDRINWEEVAENNDVNYVYIKATEHAGLVDNMFHTNAREAHRVGIPVGCYHFFSPTAAPLAQLKNLTSAVPSLKDHDLVPMIDVEVKGKKTTPEELRLRLRQFLKAVEDYYGVRPIIYTGMNFYNNFLAGYFEDYLFMIAKYSEGVPELDGNAKFAMWQYSASGRIKGIRGAVDCSCFMDNYSLRDILIKRK